MGVPLGGLPFDVAFFAAGCVAKRNGWLDDIQSMAPRDYWLARLAALVAVVSTGVVATVIGLDEVLSLRLGPFLLLCTWLGVMTGGISVSVLHFFAVHCNSSSRWQKLAGESQYAVYVLQTITLPVVMFTLVLILRTAGYTVEFEFLQVASPVGHCRRLDLHSRVGHRDLVAAGIPISEVAVREGCVVGLGRLVCTRIQRHCSVFFRPANQRRPSTSALCRT